MQKIIIKDPRGKPKISLKIMLHIPNQKDKKTSFYIDSFEIAKAKKMIEAIQKVMANLEMSFEIEGQFFEDVIEESQLKHLEDTSTKKEEPVATKEDLGVAATDPKTNK